MTTILIPAADLQQVKEWAVQHVPAAAPLKALKLAVNAFDVTVEAEQFGDVVVRIQVVPDSAG